MNIGKIVAVETYEELKWKPSPPIAVPKNWEKAAALLESVDFRGTPHEPPKETYEGEFVVESIK